MPKAIPQAKPQAIPQAPPDLNPVPTPDNTPIPGGGSWAWDSALLCWAEQATPGNPDSSPEALA